MSDPPSFLNSLPTELLVQIFDYVELLHYLSLIRCGATCVRFRRIISAKLSVFNALSIDVTVDRDDWSGAEERAPHQPLQAATEVWDPVFLRYFKPLISSPSQDDRRRHPDNFFCLDKFNAFHRLPCMASAKLRERFFRREASWRRIPLVSMSDGSSSGGRSLIRQVDVVRLLNSGGSAQVPGKYPLTYSQVDMESLPVHMIGDRGTKCLTIGAYYDLLLSAGVLSDNSLCSWKLFPGRRLRSFDRMYDIRSTWPGFEFQPRIEPFFEPDVQSAVLFVQDTSRTCPYVTLPDSNEQAWTRDISEGHVSYVDLLVPNQTWWSNIRWKHMHRGTSRASRLIEHWSSRLIGQAHGEDDMGHRPIELEPWQGPLAQDRWNRWMLFPAVYPLHIWYPFYLT